MLLPGVKIGESVTASRLAARTSWNGSLDVRRCRVPRIQQEPHPQPDPFRSPASRRLRGTERVQVGGGVLVEPEGPGQRVQHLRRRAAVAALLEPGVVLGADSREHGQLVAPQAGHAPVTVVGQAGVGGADQLAPGLQVFADQVHVPAHDRLPLSLRIGSCFGLTIGSCFGLTIGSRFGSRLDDRSAEGRRG
jgi:hypothetical protein